MTMPDDCVEQLRRIAPAEIQHRRWQLRVMNHHELMVGSAPQIELDAVNA